MTTIRDYLKAAKKVRENLTSEVDRIIEANSEKALELIKEQLSEGKNMFGADIRPLYTEDTFFKSTEAAVRYADWKNKMFPNSKRSRFAPNLFINGQFYSEITIQKNIFKPSGALSSKVFAKYRDVFSLNEEKNVIFNNDIIYPEVMEYLNKYL